MERYIDYDAARAERRGEPVVVHIFGRDWTLYPALPAKVMLDLARLESDLGPDGEVEWAAMLNLAREAIPPEVLDAWLDQGLALEEFAELFGLVMRAYVGGEDDKEPDEPGEAPAPAASERKTSSRGGR